MSKRGQSAGAFTLIAILMASAVFSMGRATTDAQGVAQPHEQTPQSAIQQDYGQLPLSFVPNVGQTDAEAQFQVNSLGGTLFFTPGEVVLSLPQAKKRADHVNPEQRIAMLEHDAPTVSESPLVVKLQLIGANTAAEIAGTDRLPGIVNYFIGNDPSKWHTNISTYAGIVYRNVYPGIDLQYDGHEGRLKGTYTVAAGADPSVIGWRYAGNAGLSVDDQTGDLLIMLTNGSVLREVAPTAWQDKAGKREAVETRYMVDGEDVRFGIGAYDARLPLVIDPEFVYSTYLGGSGLEHALAIAVDSSGNAYVVGDTSSTDFPLQNSLQSILSTPNDVFVSKLNSTGNALVYSTYLGGTGSDTGYHIALDSNGNAYITGETDSSDFPMHNAFQNTKAALTDAFVTKLNVAGNALFYSTYLGGDNFDAARGIAVDNGEHAYVAGGTQSTNFPIQNAFQGALKGAADAFVVKFNATGDDLIYATYLGGTDSAAFFYKDGASAIAVDSSGNAYITGIMISDDFPTQNPLQASYGGSGDAFVTKLNATGNALIYSTYLGGSIYDYGYSIAVDNNGYVYISGETDSTDFPTKNAIQAALAVGYYSYFTDVFVTKLNPAGDALIFSTYLGGEGFDMGFCIDVDGEGNAYIMGMTGSPNFPTVNAIQPTMVDHYDAFVAKIDTTGYPLRYSTFLGGSVEEIGYGIAVDSVGNAYVTGVTWATNFPTHNAFQPNAAGNGDAFITKLSAGDSVSPTKTATATGTIATSTDTPTSTVTSTHTVTPSATTTSTATPTSTPSATATGTMIAAHQDTIGIFRASVSTFYLRNSNTTGFADSQITFGASSYFPITGDWNGDGIDTAGVYKSSTGQFFLTNSTANPAVLSYSFVLGNPGDQPIVGDWDGDGRDGVGVFRPSNGLIYLKNSLTTGFADFTMVLGVPGDVGIAGDWNGDGKDSPGVYRPSNQVFYLSNAICNCSVFADAELGLGIAGDTPFVGDWDGDGKSGVGVYRQSNGLTYIKNALTTGFADSSFVFGSASDYPLAGYWVRVAAPTDGEPAPTFMP